MKAYTPSQVYVYTPNTRGAPREGFHQRDVFAFVVYLGKEEVGEHATMTWLYFIFLPRIISTFLLVNDKRELPKALNKIPICTETTLGWNLLGHVVKWWTLQAGSVAEPPLVLGCPQK